jgi:hypothetical protein
MDFVMSLSIMLFGRFDFGSGPPQFESVLRSKSRLDFDDGFAKGEKR